MEHALFDTYKAASKRLFLLDYDGTLSDLKPTPPEARPTPKILQILRGLAAQPGNTVVIISGRKHEEMDKWFSALPVSLVAEHGLLVKRAGQSWQTTVTMDTSWKDEVRSLMDSYTSRLPGTITEEKTAALVWHSRNASDHSLVAAAVTELLGRLKPICKQHKLKLMLGKEVIEVQQQGYDKGTAAAYWLTQDKWGFVLGAGDDITDEDLLAALPTFAITIKVGGGNSIAKQRIASPSAMIALLTALTA